MVPVPTADLGEIWEFALTFDGYEYYGSFEKCADVANGHKHDTLTDLRTCLFFEQRRWRHFGEQPSASAVAYLRELVEAIHHKVKEKELD